MSSPNPIVVNCGATHASVSVFSKASGQLKLEKFLVQELAYDYTNEDAWLDALTVTLRAMVRALKVSGNATVIVPGNMLLTKNIKVPQVEKSRQQQIIAFEAGNNLPYGLHEMVWGSQIIATDGVEAEVALFAMKLDVATKFTEAFISVGLKPKVVQAATLLDYQAYHLADRTLSEEVLLLNIGARSTNLTFISSSGFSIQNVSIGGNMLTQALSDNLGKPFQAAEQLKLQYFTGAIQSNPGDPLADTLKTNAETFVRRLNQEITRRIINYKRSGHAPTKILLTGRAALLPGLSEKICDAQKISVEYFDPTAVLQLGQNVKAQYLEVFRFQMSEAVGEAARLLIPDAVGVDLLPPAIKEAMEFAKKKPFIVFAMILLAAAPWPAAKLLNEWNDAVKKSAQTTNAEVEKYAGNQAKIEAAEKATIELSHRLAELNYIAAARGEWRDFLIQLQKSVVVGSGTSETTPPVRHAWIEKMKVTRTEVKAPAKTSNDTAWTPPKAPPTEVSITIETLMDEVAPGADLNSELINAKFRLIGLELQKTPFVSEVKDGTVDNAQTNLPKREFKLVINPQQTL